MNEMAAESEFNDAVIQLVTFRLMDESYGINVMKVQEVLRVSEIAPGSWSTIICTWHH